MNHTSLARTTRKSHIPSPARPQDAQSQTIFQNIPNSALLDMIEDTQSSGDFDVMDTRIAMLNHQIPTAEQEADRLAEGVSSRTEEGIKAEMGQRLGTDFSDVRFHTDSASAGQADTMGARAWTQGQDVYFGAGGFEPAVAAHELVHTVQQGAVSGSSAVTQSAPMGEVQMKGIFGGIKKLWHKLTGKKEAPQQQLSGEERMNLYSQYNDLMGDGDLDDDTMAIHNGTNNVAQQQASIQRQLLNDEAAREEAEYQAAMQQLMAKRMAANPDSKAAKKALNQQKKAWEFDDEDFARNVYNPGEHDDVAAIQKKIDKAKNPSSAFDALAGFAGMPTKTDGTSYLNGTKENIKQINLERFKARMKNMARMMHDYPELKPLIKDMDVRGYDGGTTMSTKPRDGFTKNFEGMNIYYYAENGHPQAYDPEYNAADRRYSGVHELGHALGYHLAGLKKQKDTGKYSLDDSEIRFNTMPSTMLKKVIRKVVDPSKWGLFRNNEVNNKQKYKQLDLTKKKQRKGKLSRAGNEVNLYRSADEKAFGSEFTSGYARSKSGDAHEFFAEAFADVYAHGKKARKASIVLVQEYERRRDKMLRQIADKKQQNNS